MLKLCSNSRKIMTGPPERLSPFFKRIAYKKGRVAAITATARKLAVIIWNMLTKEEPYKRAQLKATVQKTREAGLRQMQRRLVALDLSQDELKRLFCKNLFVSGIATSCIENVDHDQGEV